MKKSIKTHHQIVQYQAKRIYINRYQVKHFPGAWLFTPKFVTKFEFETVETQLLQTLCKKGFLNSFVNPTDYHIYFQWHLVEDEHSGKYIQCSIKKREKDYIVAVYKLILIK